MDVRQIVREQDKILWEMSPPLEAAGVGGSVGREKADSYSDVDFFLLYPSNSFFGNLKQFPQLITHTLPVLLHMGPTFEPGFGFKYSYILQDGVEIDYIINCPDTLDLNPMRAHTSILFDNTGFLTNFTEAAHSQVLGKSADSARDAMHDYISRLLKLRGSVSRNDLPVFYYNLDKLRLVMVGVDRALTSETPYNSPHADHRLGQEMGVEYEREVLTTFPSYSHNSLSSVVEEICKRINIGIRSLDADCVNWFQSWALEKRLKTEILLLVEELL